MYIHYIPFAFGFCYHKINVFCNTQKIVIKNGTVQPKYLLLNGGSQCTDVLLRGHEVVIISLSL